MGCKLSKLPTILTAAVLSIGAIGFSNENADARNHHGRSQIRHAHKLSRHHHKLKPVATFVLQPQVGVLVMSEKGQTVMDEMSDIEFNPASVAKLVTAYGAIKTFGLNHEFVTKVLYDGDFDKASGVLTGNLYIQGIDPDFEREDALELKQLITAAGLKKVTGKMIVSSGFSYGSASDANWSGKNLARLLHSSLRIHGGTAIGDCPEVVEALTEYHSESLKETLKEMLSYSQNNVAEQIGRSAGGIVKLEDIVTHEAGLQPGALKLASASGLGKGRVKPKDMMLVLKGLRSELRKQNLDLQDICPVAGIDHGTLDERFRAPVERGSVIGKTGTLPGTDGGTSTLVGMFRAQKEDYYFVIFCWKGDVVSFRHQQDNLIRKLQTAHGGPKAFDYALAKANM